MITHNIIVTPAVQTSPKGWPYPGTHTPRFQQHVKKMDKLEYTKYVTDLGLKDGDIVYSYNAPVDNGKSIWELPKHRFFIIGAVQEIHYSVEYKPNGEPMCLYLINLMNMAERPNVGGFWTSVGLYKKVDYNDLNMECKQIVDTHNSRNQTN